MTFAPHIDDRVPHYAEPTDRQIEYARGMQKTLHLSNRLLDGHCEAQFCRPFAQLTRSQVSTLIGQMKGWTAIPDQLLREAGQMDLFGGDR